MAKYLIMVFAVFSTTLFANEECSSPENTCETLNIYQEALEHQKDGEWQQAKSKAEQAIALLPYDGETDYIKLCLIDNSTAYISDISVSECPATASYYPNQMVLNIKREHSPKAAVMISYTTKVASWGLRTFSLPSKLSAKSIQILNAGSTELDDVNLTIYDRNSREISQNYDHINAKTHKNIRLTTAIIEPITIILTEKHGFGIND
ncbi:hypothetical protein CXF85_11155 [Colwellia sp. 75C3]|uniref:hypothetical protein n=1 Tax=Colwellia sp. 75C3 TaxID=888425 RepID=UPI000C338BED|nr:hypothetical protein [Colwellia sp. 75C3]PKG83280.1 hypothetical protein CXF85_11155 [Colwellia sp. 75C3]